MEVSLSNMSMCIRNLPNDRDQIWVAPSGVQKERIQPEDIFVLDDKQCVLKSPQNDKLRVSECTPLFYNAYYLRNVGFAHPQTYLL